MVASIHRRKMNPGQSFLEYALLLVLVVIVILAVLLLTGRLTAIGLRFDFSSSQTPTIGTAAATDTPIPLTTAAILQDMQSRIMAYYQLHHSWPRTWSPYNFTDIGLNPDDYSQPINGLYFSPHGSNIGIANKAGDSLQVYVKNLDGTMQHLIDGWSIWCDAASSVCYYHTIASGNEVDISSIVVTGL
jgi:Flp pilus assembly pilin Flp